MAQVSTNSKTGLGRFVYQGVDFNAGNTDTPIKISTVSNTYRVSSMSITNASQTLTTATIGLFTGAGGTGTLIADTAVTVATATVGDVNSMQVLTGPTTINTDATTLYIRVGTPEGAAATADVIVDIMYLN
jgi:hypothetical protein